MVEIRFDYIKNFDVPESWIENVLDKSLEKKKKTVLPLPRRLYYYAAGIAACVVIVAAVSLSLMFGLNNDVSLMNSNPEPPSKADLIVEQTTDKDGGDISTAPSKKPGVESPMSTALTEPPENIGKEKQKTAAPKSTEPNTQSTAKPGSKANPKFAEPDKTEADTQPLTVPCVEDNTQLSTSAKGEEKCYFETFISSEFAAGDIYCRLEDGNGNILGDGNLFDKSRFADKESVNNDSVRLSYVVNQTLAEKAEENYYSVIFYNSSGVVIKKSVPVPIYKNLYFRF